MDLVRVIGTSIGSIIALFLITKLIGYQQMSQMSMFDYINGITIGSIAAEMATSLEQDYLKPLLAMIVYGLMVTMLSIITNKSIRMRRLMIGTSIILYDHDEIYYYNMKKAKINLGEFLMQCRMEGYFNLSDIQTVILEANGHFSILPKTSQRPVTPADLELQPVQEYLVANVIIDGEIMHQNLKYAGKDVNWLREQIKQKGVEDITSIVLATCDIQGGFMIYSRINKQKTTDVLE